MLIPGPGPVSGRCHLVVGLLPHVGPTRSLRCPLCPFDLCVVHGLRLIVEEEVIKLSLGTGYILFICRYFVPVRSTVRTYYR